MQADNGKYHSGIDPVKAKRLNLLSRLATFTCILMYVSYIPEIMANFSGTPVNPIQPLVAMINATLWTGYGWMKPAKDWPIIIANVPGILFGLITFVTVFVH
ncbi:MULTISPECIES: SemiSWEET family transporter [Lacticaseibacillus]|jgi:hypothetical protein|nr:MULTISPECIES: SemiSWEET family transporter [Lacticaseibacillus]OFR89839.1 hypothetical protein HMPREF2861_01780 [Lactobacillus sp. HMSC068F07]ARY90809.1 hypothetical protein BGL52_03115 [Lacticaseibacillus casei]KAB1970671.1 hypothetical protein F9B82_04800 [Lacticaseibacillus casei]KLI75144.1 membrane protein [Lacticaseibacillus casei]MBI6596514.1 hypothetical protein [Lacticaseibacillus casei]